MSLWTVHIAFTESPYSQDGLHSHSRHSVPSFSQSVSEGQVSKLGLVCEQFHFLIGVSLLLVNVVSVSLDVPSLKFPKILIKIRDKTAI